MYLIITFVISFLLIFMSLLTIGRDMVETFSVVTGSWIVLQSRSEERTNTRIAAPVDLSVISTPTVQITLSNEGDVALAQFADWDVIFEVQQNPGFAIAYLSYTEDVSPDDNEWTVSGIYRDASSLAAEVVDPGVLNPGEEMVVLAKPSPAITAGTYDRAVFVTPNGAAAKVIFRVSAYLYVLDSDDGLAYRYLDDGTYIDAGVFHSSNTDAQGVTTDGTGFWTADATDDEAYEYAANFGISGTWGLAVSNADAQGITTDGSSIWVVDSVSREVFKYDTAGAFDSSFALEPSNAAPTGITTDGSNIWIVDGGGMAFKYDMAGAFVSSFALDAANADPTGITTNGSNIWVVDREDKKIYTYEMDGTYVADADITLHNDNADAQGITIKPR